MKNIIICIVILFYCRIIIQGESNNLEKNDNYSNVLGDTSATLLINGALVPRAVITENKDIICIATRWSETFPLVVEKIDSNHNLLWNGISLSIPQKSNDTDGNAFILPCSDGSAYFAFEYHDFRKWENGMDYVARYPHIQRVDAKGKVMWGAVGVRLTDLIVGSQGGADIKHICFAPDGDIMIYWTWFNDYNTAGVENEFGTFVQKVDPSSGELKFGESGRKLFNFRAGPIKQSPNGNIYMFQDRLVFQNGGDSVACFNVWAEKQWQLPLLTGIGYNVLVGTNDYGELLIIYETNEDIRASLYDENGSPIWTDKILSTSVKRVIPNIITTWDKDSWIFKMGQAGTSVYCVNRNGNICWGDIGIKFTGGIYSVQPLDNESILVAFGKSNESGNFVYDLYIQKLNKNGEPLWQSEGIKVFENVNTNCIILPDKNGDAYLIFDALTQYEPQFRPRGTYLQKVDKDGNLGLITSIKDNETNNNTASTASVVCYPNPSNGMITFRLKTESGNAVNELILYDILGREIRRFNIGSSSYGETFLQWDGKNSNGVKAALGIYFYYMKTKNNINLSGKFLRVR